MLSRNNWKEQVRQQEPKKQRFTIKKLTIGVASVLIGFTFMGMSASANAQTTPATSTTDTTQAVKQTTPATPATSTTDTTTPIAPSTTVPSYDGTKVVDTPFYNNPQGTNSDKTSSATANSNNALAQAKSESVVQSKVSGTSTEAKPNAADPVSLAKIKPQEAKLAKLVYVKALAKADNQFNFDDWTTQIDDTYLNITGYKGDRSKQIVVPNGADFAKAGKNDQNLQVEIDQYTLAGLIVNGVAPKLSNTDGQKIVAKGDNWNWAFWSKNLHDISGLANLDTSNVTYMVNMFGSNQISDLSPLANWNTSNVTNMDSMFAHNQISDLSPLASWNTGNVTEMVEMFKDNKISNLSPLANWNTSKVTYMSNMFNDNQIRDLSPLSNWNIGNVTNMSGMFDSNQISDLRPLASWSTGNVTDMSNMFSSNPDLIDLSPIANWNISSVEKDYSLFSGDTNLNLTNINNTPLMQGFLKTPNALGGAIFITNNADLVKAITGQDLKDNLNGTAHRHIIVETPDHKDENSHTSQTIDQTIDYSRDAKVDTVTGEVNSYTPWTATDSTKTSFDEKHIDAIDGYDISVEGATEGTDYVVNKDGSITINANTPDPTKFANSVTDFDPTKILPNSTITVKYTAQKKTVTIHYVDDDNGGQPAKDAQDKTIDVVTDQNLDGNQLTYDVPSIYHLADNSGEVTNFHVNADDSKNVITVHLKQNTGVPIDPDKIPDGTKNPEDGDNPITKDEFTHDVHRTVTVDYPASYTGEKPDLSQTITLSRTATYNQVTGVVTWSAWSTGKFDAETPVAIAGYTPSVSSIAEMPVTHDTADQTVHITYTAGQQSMTWTFVDDDEGGKTVGSPITLTGDTDTSIAADDLAKGLAIPKNYDLDDTYTNTNIANVNQIPTSFTFHATNIPVMIHLKHHHQDIDATHIPSGAKDKDDQHVITANDFLKTINRTIEFDTPTHESSTSFNTGASAQHHDQSVTLQRQGDYDAVTGLVTWKPWSEADFDAVNVGKDGIPTFDGYDIDPDNSVGFDKDNNRIDAMHVTSDTKPSVVIIRYKAQDHKVTYHFVDENGKQQTEPDGTTPIADETVSGKTDDTINTPKLPDGWVLDGDTLDPTVKVPTSDTTVNVKIKHGQVTVTHDNPVKNGDKNVPSEPAKTPDTNPSDATHVDKPGEVDNKGQDQGNKGQGTMTDDNKGQGTKTNNNKNDEKSAKPGKKQENGKKHVNAKKSTSNRNAPVHGETVNGKSKAKKNTNSNVRPHAEVKPTTRNAAPKAQVMPAGQHVNAKGQILNTKGQVVGHVDKNAQAVLPQTGEKTTPLAWLGLGLASLAAIFGLAGDRKRR